MGISINSGCAIIPTSRKQNKNINTNASKILFDSISVGFNLNAIVAQASMKAVDKKGDFTLRCSAQILAKRPDKLLIVATKGLGTEILQLSLINESLNIYLPRKKTLYKGKINDLNDADMNFHPQDIVEQVLFPTKNFLNLKWKTIFEDEKVIMLQAKQKSLGRHLLTINKETRTLMRRQLFNNKDVCAIDVAFSRYKKSKELEGKLYPRKFKLHFPTEKKDLYIVLRKISFNENLPTKEFILNIPKKNIKKIKPLGKRLSKDGDNISLNDLDINKE